MSPSLLFEMMDSTVDVALLYPMLQVNGPVDDVEEDVRPRKDNPRVLVYGMCIYPNVHVASGRFHLPCNLGVVKCHLGQHSLLPAPVFRHPIITCSVHIHGPIASDLGVNHHLIWIADATGTRELERKVSHKCDYGKHNN